MNGKAAEIKTAQRKKEGYGEPLTQLKLALKESVKLLEKFEMHYLSLRYDTHVPSNLAGVRQSEIGPLRGKALVDIALALGMWHQHTHEGRKSDCWLKSRWLGAHLRQLHEAWTRKEPSLVLFCNNMTQTGAFISFYFYCCSFLPF